MQQNTLISILKLLDKKELTEFARFLQSPFHTQDTKAYQLFQRLRRYHPSFESDRLSTEALFRHVFPDEEFQENKVYKLMSKLGKLAEDFLVVKQVLKQEVYLKHLQQAYSERNEYSKLELLIIDRFQKLEQETRRDIFYYQEKVALYHQLFFHQAAALYDTGADGIEKLMHNLDTYYWLAKLRYACEMLTRQRTLAKSYDVPFLQQAKALANELPFSENPLFSLYLTIIDLHQNGHQEFTFQSATNLFIKYADLLKSEEQYIILQNLLNHLANLSRQTGQPYVQELRALHLFGLEKNVFVVGGRMTSTLYMNIAATSSAMQEFEWTAQFIDNFKQYLEPKSEKAAFLIAMAFLSFYKGFWLRGEEHFEQANKYLRLLEGHQLSPYTILLHSLQVRIFYELFQLHRNELNDNALAYNLDSFEKFLRRDDVINLRSSQSYIRFVQYARRIYHLYKSERKERIEGLRKKIAEDTGVVLKFWLLEKLEELSKSL